MEDTGCSFVAAWTIHPKRRTTLSLPRKEPLCQKWSRPLVPDGILRCAVSVHMESLSETGKVESYMTFRTTAYLEGKPAKGQQPADESGSKSKGGTFAFRKFSVYDETGQLSNPSSRVMVATSVIPSLWWRRRNTMFSSMIWQRSLRRTAGNEPKKGTNGHLTTVNVPYAQKRDRLHAQRRKATESS